MRRFFKSAAFPILLVVILAFVAQKVISQHDGPPPPSYNEFLTQIEKGEVKKVTINTKDNTLDVQQTNDTKYSTGYPNNTEQSLVNELQRNDVDLDVKGTGGSSLLS